MEQHPEIITTARKYLVRAFPFYATLVMRLPLVRRDATKTMATDGKAIYYNPAWTGQQKPLEVAGVLAHEALHVGLLHHTRRGDRDRRGWNHAADYAINAILLESGLFQLPDGGLYREEFSGLSAERIYELLKQERTEQQKKPGEGEPGGQGEGSGDPQAGEEEGSAGDIWAGLPEKAGEVLDMPGAEGGEPGAAEVADEERAVAASVFQAAQAEKSCGSVPGAFEAVLGAHRHQPLDWKAMLRQLLTEKVADDYSWSRPSRRSHACGVFLPGRDEEPRGELIIAVDTSGSVSQDELDAFAGEVQEIADEVRLTSAVVIYCDSRISRVDEFEEGDELLLEKPTGRGGTKFDPPFEWIEEEDRRPHAVIYLTDGVATVKRSEPDYPVIWATTTVAPGFKGDPWGDVVELDLSMA